MYCYQFLCVSLCTPSLIVGMDHWRTSRKGPQEVHLIQPPAQSKVSYETRPKTLLKALSCLLFKPLKNGDRKTSMGNLFQYYSSLGVLKFFL